MGFSPRMGCLEWHYLRSQIDNTDDDSESDSSDGDVDTDIDPPVVDIVAGKVNNEWCDTDSSDGADGSGVSIALFRANYICERVCYLRNWRV